MKKWLAALAVVSCVAGFGATAHADWPHDKTITIVTGYPAGTGSDLVSRLLADALSKKLGATIIVDDRPGAAGTIAQAYVAKVKPDGYTFIVATPSSSANAKLVYTGLPYDPMTDFTPISRTNSDSMVLVAGPRLAAKNLQEFKAYALANPGQIQLGNPGFGTYAHMGQLKMQDLWGAKFNIVLYKGAPQMITDMMDKQIDAVMDLLGGYYSNVQAGTLRVLAVFGKNRDPKLPNVPTAAEQGTDLSVDAFFGMEGPKGIPADIVTKMNQAINDVENDPDFKAKMTGLGITPSPSTPKEYDDQLHAEVEKWRPVITKYNIKAD